MTSEKQNRINLPKGFLLGAASSAHQVEGNNTNNDWWHYEQAGRLPKSGLAADHYHRYGGDFQIAKQIGLNAMRISLEWSRIEPEEGKFSEKEIQHYREVLQTLKNLGLKRMVTLHHYTLPLWLASSGGFSNKKSIDAFGRYAKFVAEQLGGNIDFWLTINEPELFTYMGYINGAWPPFQKNIFRARKVINNLAKAHNSAYEAIRSVLPSAQISIAKNTVYYDPYRPSNYLDRVAVFFASWLASDYFINKIKNHMNFIGINYYFYHTLKFHPLKLYRQMNLAGPKSDMGWRTYPQGLYHLLKHYQKYGKPIYVTENGIANAHDDMRQNFIYEHLKAVADASSEGVDVRGYFYWSLTDTYEWQDGFGPKFGLVEINFNMQSRRVRPSSEIFKQLKY